jgi:predicted dehydrogenase
VTVGVAIIGCGLIGTKRAHALPPEARLVSVCDADPDRAQQLAASFDDVECAKSAEAAYSHPDVALVIVATSHRGLAPISCAALDAGKHVLVEKPGAADLEGARAVEARATATGLTANVGFNHRFHPSFLEARRIVESGEFGPVMFVRARYGHGGRLGYEQEWRAKRELSGGGELIDQGIHLVDLTRFLVGDITLAFAELRTSFWNMDVEDNVFLALRGAGGGAGDAQGAFAWLHASWTEWKNLFSFEVMLERAKIDVSGLGGSYGPETMTVYEMQPEMGPPPSRVQQWDASDGSWRAELQACLDNVEGRTSPAASIADAVAALRIVDAAYRGPES